MFELTEEGRQLVDALVKAPVAWQSVAELSSAIGRDMDETSDLLATMDAGGWLAAWEREFDLVVTLSVGAASHLGVRLVEIGPEEVPRWALSGDPEPPSPRASRVFRGEKAASLELVVDPSASPLEMIERAEATLARHPIPSDPRHKAMLDRLPAPTLLIGSGLSPWPGPGDGRKASCPSCGSKRLKPSMYCLYCDRWGLDHLFRDEPPPRVKAFRDPRDDARRRELERQTRKAKRRARRFEQVETERLLRRTREQAAS